MFRELKQLCFFFFLLQHNKNISVSSTVGSSSSSSRCSYTCNIANLPVTVVGPGSRSRRTPKRRRTRSRRCEEEWLNTSCPSAASCTTSLRAERCRCSQRRDCSSRFSQTFHFAGPRRSSKAGGSTIAASKTSLAAAPSRQQQQIAFRQTRRKPP